MIAVTLVSSIQPANCTTFLPLIELNDIRKVLEWMGEPALPPVYSILLDRPR